MRFKFILALLFLLSLSNVAFSVPANEPNVTAEDGSSTLIDNQDGRLTWRVEGVNVANFTGYFFDDLYNIIPINWTAEYNSENITYNGHSSYGTFVSWFLEKENGFKYGASFDSDIGSVTTRVQFYWEVYEGTTIVQDQEIPERIYIINPQLSDIYLFDFVDMPDGSALVVNVTDGHLKAEASFIAATSWNVDPNLGGTEDGFDQGRTATAVDGLQSHQVDIRFYDFQNAVAGSEIGSFDDADDAATTRNPMSITGESSVSVAAGTNRVNVTVFTSESCSGGIIFTQNFTNDNNLLAQPNTFYYNISTASFDGNIGELCVQMQACADNGVAPVVCTTDQGKVGVAPLVNSQSVSLSNINYFKTQTVAHSLEAAEAGDISGLNLQLQTSGGTNLKAIETDTTPATDYTQRIIDISPNQANNTVFRYNNTNWTDNSLTHSMFSSSSTGAVSRFGPKSPTFTLRTDLGCTALTNDDGITLYNVGLDTANRSGTVNDVNGGAWSETTSVTFDIFYRNSTNDQQFTNTSFDISSGSWDRDTPIPSTANSDFDKTGELYNMRFVVDNDADTGEANECVYASTFRVSNLIQSSTNPTAINNIVGIDKNQNVTNFGRSNVLSTYLFFARDTRFTAQSSITVRVLDRITSALEDSVTSESTNGTGFLDRTFTHDSADAINALFNNRSKYVQVGLSGNWLSNDSGVTNGSAVTHNLSRALYASTTPGTIDNDCTVGTAVVNRGMVQNGTCYLFYANNDVAASKTGITINVLDSTTSNVEQTISSETTDANGYNTFTFTHDSNDLTNGLAADTRQKRWTTQDADANRVTYNNVTEGVNDQYALSERLAIYDANSKGQVNATPERYNRGEQVEWNATLVLANGTNHTGGSSVLVFYLDNTTANQHTDSAESISAAGLVISEFPIEGTDTADQDPYGTPYRVRIVDGTNNTLSFDLGVTNGTASQVFNATRFLLINGQCQSNSSRADPVITYPNENNAFHQPDYIIGESVATCWANVRGARNNAIDGATVDIRTYNPDGTLVDTNSLPTGANGWTGALAVSPVAPAGTWFITFNVSSFNSNTGGEFDILNFISAFTGNIFVTSSFEVLNGNYKNIFNFGNQLRIWLQNGVVYDNSTSKPINSTLEDPDDNELFVTIRHQNASISPCYNNTLASRTSTGLYSINVSLNETCLFEQDAGYHILFSQKKDDKTFVQDTGFTITESEETADPISVSCDDNGVGLNGGSVFCDVELHYLNASPLSTTNAQYKVLRQDGSLLTSANLTENSGELGTYSFSFTPTTTGSHRVVVNNTIGSTTYPASTRVYIPVTFLNTTQNNLIVQTNETTQSTDSYVRSTTFRQDIRDYLYNNPIVVRVISSLTNMFS